MPTKAPAQRVVKNVRRQTRRHFSAEDKIRIVLAGLREEDGIAEPCRREGIVQRLFYTWSKEFVEAGKRRLDGDTACDGHVRFCAPPGRGWMTEMWAQTQPANLRYPKGRFQRKLTVASPTLNVLSWSTAAASSSAGLTQKPTFTAV